MPIAVANTTLSLSQIDQLREIVLQTNVILGTTIDPFTIENLNKSEWWQYEFARQVLSTNLVSEGYDPLPEFSISDLNNGKLPIVLIQNINTSLLSGGSSAFLLEATGADETNLGDGLQRFTYDGTSTVAFDTGGGIINISAWYAEVAVGKRIPEYTVNLKMPDVVAGSSVGILIADKGFTSGDLFATSAAKYIKLEVSESEGSMTLLLEDTITPANSVSRTLPSPAQGDAINLTLTTGSISYQSNEALETISIPNGFFANNPNIIVTSVGEVGVSSLSVIANPYILI